MLKQSRNALTHLAKRYRAVLRRCRLRALALALACALTALPPLPAGAEENMGGEVDSDGNFIGIPTTPPASGGDVVINTGYNGTVYGGRSSPVSEANATDNKVSVNNGTVTGNVIGGQSEKGNAKANAVYVYGGKLAVVYGGVSSINGITSDNKVIMYDGEADCLYGGGAGDKSVPILGNTVIVSGGTVNWQIAGGRSDWGSSVKDNTVILRGSPNLSGCDIFGGVNMSTSSTDVVIGNNTLVVETSGLTARSISNFDHYAFVLPDTIQRGAVLLSLSQHIDLTNNGKSPSPDFQSIDVTGDTALSVGDTVTLLKSDAGLTAGTLPESVSGTQGVTLSYTFALTTETDATGQPVSVVATVMGDEDPAPPMDDDTPDTPTGNEGGASVAPRVNPQTKALAEGYLSGVALTLQGADLVAGKGIDAAGRAVRASLAGGGKGLAAFGALSGGWSRYNTGSHIDVSGFSLLTGLAWGADSVPGQFTAGMFFEYGSAATGTYNSFSNAASVSGDGSTWYMGAGLLARMDFNDSGPGHIYAEASARAGALNNKYRNDDLRDASGRRAEFDTSTPYVSLHAGLGYVWDLTDALSLDLSAKYFWTWQDSADSDLSTGEALHFDAVNSHRLRLGGRLTWAVTEHVSPYVGAAWEHEFDGKARATSLGYDLDAPSLTGDTGIGELGLSWTPSATIPLTIDLSLQGYTGVREGYTGSLMAKWEF